jgi:hypothetical protein
LAPKYQRFDTQTRAEATEFIEESGEGGSRLLSRVDSDTARKVLYRPCRRGVGGVGGAGTAGLYSVSLSQNCDLSEEEWEQFGRMIGQSKNINDERVSAAYRIADESPETVRRLSFETPLSRGGADQVTRLIARADPEADSRLDVEQLETFATTFETQNGPTLRTLFELDLDSGNEVRTRLVEFYGEDGFSRSRARQFVADAKRLEGEGIDGFNDGPGSLMDEFGTHEQADNLVGDQYELRVAAAGDINDVQSIGKDLYYPDGEQITDLDLVRPNEIVEAKNKLNVERGRDKLENFEEAHEEGKINLNEKDVKFTSGNKLSSQEKSVIRQRARDIEGRSDNGINNIDIKFNQVDTVE